MRLTFLALVFVSLFSGLAVANEEMAVPAAEVGIAPTALPLLIAIPVIVIGGAAAFLVMGAFVYETVLQPVGAFIAIMLMIWLFFKGFSLIIRSVQGYR